MRSLQLDFASQVSLASDYNIFDMAGNGIVGTWAGGVRTDGRGYAVPNVTPAFVA